MHSVCSPTIKQPCKFCRKHVAASCAAHTLTHVDECDSCGVAASTQLILWGLAGLAGPAFPEPLCDQCLFVEPFSACRSQPPAAMQHPALVASSTQHITLYAAAALYLSVSGLPAGTSSGQRCYRPAGHVPAASFYRCFCCCWWPLGSCSAGIRQQTLS